MKLLLLVVLLFAGLQKATYSFAHPAIVSDTVFDGNDHRDIYLHPDENRPSVAPSPPPSSNRKEWFAKGLVASLIMLMIVGWVRERSK